MICVYYSAIFVDKTLIAQIKKYLSTLDQLSYQCKYNEDV